MTGTIMPLHYGVLVTMFATAALILWSTVHPVRNVIIPALTPHLLHEKAKV